MIEGDDDEDDVMMASVPTVVHYIGSIAADADCEIISAMSEDSYGRRAFKK